MVDNPITIFIVDDQPVFRLGLKTALDQTEDISVVGQCSHSDEAVELVCSFQPVVALVGTTPPRHKGLDLCRRIGQRSPGLRVIVVTHTEDSGELLEAARSGAWGYVSKSAEPESHIAAIRKVAQGVMPLQETVIAYPDVGRRLLEEFQEMARNPRMREVMAPPVSTGDAAAATARHGPQQQGDRSHPEHHPPDGQEPYHLDSSASWTSTTAPRRSWPASATDGSSWKTTPPRTRRPSRSPSPTSRARVQDSQSLTRAMRRLWSGRGTSRRTNRGRTSSPQHPHESDLGPRLTHR